MMSPTEILDVQNELRDLQRGVYLCLTNLLQRPSDAAKTRLAVAMVKEKTLIQTVLKVERPPGFQRGHSYGRKSKSQSQGEDEHHH